MDKFLGYRCSLCGTEYGPTEITYTCPKDGGNLDVILDIAHLRDKYQADDIVSRADSSLWRYLPLLPVAETPVGATPLHTAGWTPVYNLARLGEKLGIRQLWLKDRGPNVVSAPGTPARERGTIQTRARPRRRTR